MAITYNAGTNIITVTGYTEGTPCNFADLYNADKAGTLSLHARTGIVGVDGAGVAVDRAERPADYIVLGGASNDLYIVVTNWNGVNSTIRITGTDRDGAAQTEDIVVNANGTYYTTKWFKTITHTHVTAANVTTYDYDLTQGQWGVVKKQCNNQYCFNCRIYIGNGVTATWFADVECCIIFEAGFMTAHYQPCFETSTNSNFRLGYLDDLTEKITSKGCVITSLESTYRPNMIAKTGGTVYLYSSVFVACNALLSFLKYPTRMWNSVCDDSVSLISSDSNVYNFASQIFYTEGIRIVGTGGTYDKVLCARKHATVRGYAVNFEFKHGTLSNLEGRGNYQYDILGYQLPAGNSYMIDSLFPSASWTLLWSACNANAKIYRQYSFDLKVIDKDNVAINAATVKIWDKDSNLIVDTTTDVNGVIATQTITRGYYNQANGNTLQEASPHLIKIEKAGYTTYEADFTLEDKTDWLIALQVGGGGLLRNPPLTGGMV